MSILELKDVCYSYSAEKPVLRGMNCTFECGTLYALVGKSGAGKSTLLSLMAGLDLPDSGQVLFEGTPTGDMDLDEYRRRKAAVIYQDFALFPLLTALENIEYPMELCRVEAQEAERQARELARRVSLPDELLDRYPTHISGGEQQRVAIARGLTMDRRLLLAEEGGFLRGLAGDLESQTPAQALAELFARLLQEDMPTLQKYEKRLTALEEALMQDQAQDLDKKLFRIRRELSVFAAYYEQLDDLFAALSDETEESDAHASRLFDRLTGRAQRLLSATELEKEYALQLREMHQTQLDMRQNQIMKILTIVTTVFLPLSLIAGWYGMNFVNMPELTAQHGYLAVCIISVVCIIVELVIFKWKKWL